jgi:FAD/FMN-containing dehydrogenase
MPWSLRECAARFQAAAGGQEYCGFSYPNYAPPDTPAKDLYGPNLARLRAIKKALDPKNRLNKGIQIVP